MVDREYQAPTPALCLLTGLNILIFPAHPEPQWIKIRSDVLPEMRFRCLTVDSALPPGVFWITSQKKLERRQVSSRQVCRRARRQISLPRLIIVWKLFKSTAQWCARRERRGKQLCVLLTPRRRSDARGDLVICVKSDTHKHSFHRFARLPSRSVGWKDRRWCASAGEITRIIFHTDQTQSTCRLSSLALYYKQRPHPPPNRPRLALINFLNTFWCVSRHKQFLFRLFDSRMPLTHKNVSGSVGEQTEPSIMSPKTVNQSGVGGLRLRLNH